MLAHPSTRSQARGSGRTGVQPARWPQKTPDVLRRRALCRRVSRALTRETGRGMLLGDSLARAGRLQGGRGSAALGGLVRLRAAALCARTGGAAAAAQRGDVAAQFAAFLDDQLAVADLAVDLAGRADDELL